MQKQSSTSSDVTQAAHFLRSAPMTQQAPIPALPQVHNARAAWLQEPAAKPVLSTSDALAHDARNALASLHLLSSLLGETGVLNEPHRHYASDLHSVAQTLTGLVSRFAGMTADPVATVRVPEATQVKAEAALSSAQASATASVVDCERLLRTIAGKNVEVFVSAERGLPPLRMTDQTLSRVLMNLVKNAREAMPDGGVVRVTARRALSRTSPAVLIHVSDNGPGIPGHALDRVFDPGFTSKQSSPEDSFIKRGLGLTIVRDLVQAVGGEVQVASTPRRGTTFELKLPSA